MKQSCAKQQASGLSWVLWILALAVALAGCSTSDKSDGTEDGTPRVEVLTVVRQPISRILSYTGDVAAEVEVRVFSTIPDRIVSLPVREGQAVRRGERLAVVRSDALGQGVQQALGALAGARAQVEGLRDRDVRQQQLLSSGVVTQAQVDATRFQLQAAEAQVAQLEAAAGSARTRRSDATVTAPISGIIGQVFLEEGDLAAPQIPICTIVQMDRVEVRLQVSERDLGLVRSGLEAEIRVPALPERTFRGVISRISPVIDRLSRTATVRIVLDNEDRALRPGSLAEVRLEVERRDSAVVVPQYALVLAQRATAGPEQGFRAFILAEGGQTAEERLVQVGIYQGDLVEVVSGLNAGDDLVVEGQHLLADESTVEVVRRRDGLRGSGGGASNQRDGAPADGGGTTSEPPSATKVQPAPPPSAGGPGKKAGGGPGPKGKASASSTSEGGGTKKAAGRRGKTGGGSAAPAAPAVPPTKGSGPKSGGRPPRNSGNWE